MCVCPVAAKLDVQHLYSGLNDLWVNPTGGSNPRGTPSRASFDKTVTNTSQRLYLTKGKPLQGRAVKKMM